MSLATTNPSGPVPDEDTDWGRSVLPTLRSPFPSAEDSIEEGTVEAAIVGVGLAGLAVAFGLILSNIPCKVFERAPQLRSNSQGFLAIQPNGMNAPEKSHPDLPSMIVEAGCEREVLIMTTINADGSQDEKLTETGQEGLAKFGRKKVGITAQNAAITGVVASQGCGVHQSIFGFI